MEIPTNSAPTTVLPIVCGEQGQIENPSSNFGELALEGLDKGYVPDCSNVNPIRRAGCSGLDLGTDVNKKLI